MLHDVVLPSASTKGFSTRTTDGNFSGANVLTRSGGPPNGRTNQSAEEADLAGVKGSCMIFSNSVCYYSEVPRSHDSGSPWRGLQSAVVCLPDSWGPKLNDFPLVMGLEFIHLSELDFGAVERDPQSFGVADPAVLFGFGDAFFEVAPCPSAPSLRPSAWLPPPG